MQNEAGKGDKRRPQQVSGEQVKKNWADIFKKKKRPK
jgi:hypothetical protein